MPASKSKTDATFDELFTFHAKHGYWPPTTHPHFGWLLIYVNRQYKRIGNSMPPVYGKHGFTQEVHSSLRKRGYTPGTSGIINVGRVSSR